MPQKTKKKSKTFVDDQGNEQELEFDVVDFDRVNSDRVSIPEGMTLAELSYWAKRRGEEEERTSAVHYELDGFPLDAAYALARAMEKVFGYATLKEQKDWFGGQVPQNFVAVKQADGTTIQVPWGTFELPQHIPGELSISPGSSTQLLVTGTVKQKDKAKIDRIIEIACAILKDDSMYRGKAFSIDFSFSMRDFEPSVNAPKFLDLANLKRSDLILPKSTERRITDSIFTPIERREACILRGISGKRGVLLHGGYGVGKTLTANVTAKIATENDTTFILLRDVNNLAQAYRLAKQYSPAVLFAEDVDRATSGERSVKLDEIFNTLDGIDSKDSQIMLVLTTNNVGAIHPGMIRPGRIDDAIEIPSPDGEAAARLVRYYGKGSLSEDIDNEVVGTKLDGMIPAVIAEVVRRARLSAVSRMTDEQMSKVSEGEIGTEDICTAADAIEEQVKLINRGQSGERLSYTNAIIEHFGKTMAKAFMAALAKGEMEHGWIMKWIREGDNSVEDELRRQQESLDDKVTKAAT